MQQNKILVHNSSDSLNVIYLPPIQCHFEVNKIDDKFNKYNTSPTSTTIQRTRNHRQYRLFTTKKENKCYQAQWLFFNESRWIPLDLANNEKLENTIRIKGTFIDIEDSHFPEVRRVRVFPELDYLSYLGVRYRLSKILLPC